MMPDDTLLLIAGTMTALMTVVGLVLTYRDAWRAILVLATLLTAINFGVFIWAELLVGRMSFQLFILWLSAFLPPLIGLALGTGIGYVFVARKRPYSQKEQDL